VLSSLNVSVQTFSPPWARARTLSVYQLIFQGGTAIGSAFFGMVAEWVGTPAALGLAALGLLLGLATAVRWRLRTGEQLDLTPSAHWPEPAVAIEPGPEEGPVLVTIEYRVEPENVLKFVAAMQSVGRMRKRTGAYEWELYSDPAETDRYVETFLARTWAEHLRQHTRPTITDQQVEERALAFTRPGSEPVVSHYIATHGVRASRWRAK